MKKTVAAAVVAAVAAFFVFQAWRWPDVGKLRTENPKTWSMLEQARKAGGEPVRRWVPYAAISTELKHAVLVAEDIDFFSHHGFDQDEIRTAIEDSLQEGKRLRGASTITQQLAKNLWLTGDRSFLRKAKEALLTFQLERRLDKRRILELYLNVVEFCPDTIGIEGAAQRYFDKPAAELDRDQAVALAASLPSSSWFPGSTQRGYLAHRSRVAARMDKTEWLLREL